MVLRMRPFCSYFAAVQLSRGALVHVVAGSGNSSASGNGTAEGQDTRIQPHIADAAFAPPSAYEYFRGRPSATKESHARPTGQKLLPPHMLLSSLTLSGLLPGSTDSVAMAGVEDAVWSAALGHSANASAWRQPRQRDREEEEDVNSGEARSALRGSSTSPHSQTAAEKALETGARHLRRISYSPDDLEDVSAAVARAAGQAWHLVLQARKAGPHDTTKASSSMRAAHPVSDRGNHVVASNASEPQFAGPQALWRAPSHVEAAARGSGANLVHVVRDFIASATAAEWYFFLAVVGVLLVVDALLLQYLPETERTHVSLLAFWVLVAATFCSQIWARLGFVAGTAWATGYLMDVIYSIDSVFVSLLICTTMEVPRRLLSKAMLIGLIGSMFFRFVLFLGLASALYSLKLVPYLVGAILFYWGSTSVTKNMQEDSTDVMQTTAVRWLRRLLGDRLCEFYDEDGEALFLVSKGKVCMTLLGALVCCILAADFFLALDVVLAKTEELPNAFLNLSSSVIALFTVRAMFFVAQDLFCRFNLTRSSAGLIVLFVGGELLLARTIYVSAALSFLVVFVIAVSIVASSALQPHLQHLVKERATA